ncbi:MAG TPA: glucose-6-phosphate dehydrogenase assembly protein OpcA [Solirubrobacteraceae bacterium]|jgi:glucose-6-phosphate dehydrogenase assembly protein OpcA|nr:glucose-6-phosphate dehydrogenase assembly protein OpcA [Solirubrobacteraceae bacterium]
MSDAVWSADDTTPGAVEAALRAMETERHQEDRAVPARVLNLVTIVDAAWRGEIENRLARVGRYHASRTVLCAVEPDRDRLSARASVHVEGDAVREHVLLEIGERHLRRLDRVIDPVVVTDLATAVWAPHGHDAAVDAVCGVAQVVLRDSVDEPDARAALDRAAELARRTYVVDLAWLRTTPWRERIAATFDPPAWRGHLRKLSAVTVRHHPDSAVAALLLLGWLASRLGWEPSALAGREGSLQGRARARRGDVVLRTEPTEQGVRGLAGVTLETADGMALSLDRAKGGLAARRRFPDGREARWTVLGASRGEPGILGEGIRQALLREPTYEPALRAARALAG